MPPSWKPNPNHSLRSTPEVPKSWSVATLPDEESSMNADTNIMDRFLAGLAPGDPGYEQVEAERLSQTHFLQRHDSFDWDEEGSFPQHPVPASWSQPMPSTFESDEANATACGRGATLALSCTQADAAEGLASADAVQASPACADSQPQHAEPAESTSEPNAVTLELPNSVAPAADIATEDEPRSEMEACEGPSATPKSKRGKTAVESVAKGRIVTSKPSAELLATMGHTLQPAQQGLRVVVIGDGWGGKDAGYEAIVTEADDYTYTVISTSGCNPWTETHVLKEHCIFLSEATTGPGGGKRRRKK